jgi:hypothetical protein
MMAQPKMGMHQDMRRNSAKVRTMYQPLLCRNFKVDRRESDCFYLGSGKYAKAAPVGAGLSQAM